jgi:hypothetical protein
MTRQFGRGVVALILKHTDECRLFGIAHSEIKAGYVG